MSGVINWNYLPEPVLLMVLKQLEVVDIVSCSMVCMDWNRTCQGEILWKYLVFKDFDINEYQELNKYQFDIKFRNSSWREEYIRLTDRFPCVRTQTMITGHVSHFTFSPDGSAIAACTKTTIVTVWKRDQKDHEFKQYCEIKMLKWGWTHVKQLYFSPSGTKLLISGNFGNTQEHHIAIFVVGGEQTYHLQNYHRFPNDNGHELIGRWCPNDTCFVGCYGYWSELEVIGRWSEAFVLSLVLCSAQEFAYRKQSHNKIINKNELERNQCDTDKCVFNSFTERIFFSDQHSDNQGSKFYVTGERPESRCNKNLFKFETQHVRYVRVFSRKVHSLHSVDRENGDIQKQENIPENKGENDEEYEDCDDICRTHLNYFADQKLYLVLVYGDRPLSTNKIGFQPITFETLKSKKCLTQPEKVFDLDNDVIESVMIPLEDFLYITMRPNYSPTQSEEDLQKTPPAFDYFGNPCRNQEIRVINLRTLKFEKISKAHQDFLRERQEQPAMFEYDFWIFRDPPTINDVSNDYMAIGNNSEVHIRDKQYGTLLKILRHDDKIERTKFNPNDQEECVTISSRRHSVPHTKLTTVQFWISKHKVRLKRRQINAS